MIQKGDVNFERKLKVSRVVNEMMDYQTKRFHPDGAARSLSPQLLKNQFNTINIRTFVDQLKEEQGKLNSNSVLKELDIDDSNS